ncbi:SET domain-containing protein 9-like isoform X2 [Gigantopelta aegis]|uniref:SET domain-containing protein 9-like isoform X2 n=1 Tax=Gigantopelta aegis TaxID=1735272 RepID=UPI001B88A9E6|nr:SET domain-containing protein 9-like isoform X2 [Gigantopelta aegis]
MLKWILKKWKQYRYRFVPWIAFNLKDRTVRSVPSQDDQVISSAQINTFLLQFFSTLQTFSTKNKTDDISSTNNIVLDKANIHRKPQNNEPLLHSNHAEYIYETNLQLMNELCGFTIKRVSSVLGDGGLGVQVTSGYVPPNSIVAMYPGVIYKPYEPLFFQSLSNSFIFRCIDGFHIDGNDKNLSKFLYRSCSQRDRIGPYETCDVTWLTPHPVNPLAVGQYVNNQSKRFPANVVYQEFDIPRDWPLQLRRFIPNVHYNSGLDDPTIESRLES